jgi:RNA polymerase sigma-70 factor (ECF subfamily)
MSMSESASDIRISQLEHEGSRQRAACVEDDLVELMNRYERPLYAYLITMLQDEDVALDCAQDTFMRAFEHLRRGKSVNARWLYTVARNRAMDEFRRTRRIEPDAEALEHIAMTQVGVDETVDVMTAMNKLSHRDREVLYLFEVAGFKTDEIGAMLHIRGSAVRQQLLRARERFRQLLPGYVMPG